ncbi:unnamed protein product [Echinostoma caproni]|uniref:Aldo_ket_red domain-containing protein n=1 Tax=Echinostoma caproni TaxID=27848 RepID=A0A183AR06_9TREM|nr:unnamed protein product [Echinostoma caproni]
MESNRISPEILFGIPMLGLGTWRAVSCAIEHGYRHIDCAYLYSNEKEIGDVLEVLFISNRIKRDELFITSKLWSTFFRPDLVEKCCLESLHNLKLTYLDLYLMHSPMALQVSLVSYRPNNAKVKVLLWAMESLVDKGLVKCIGLSNFNRRQINEIWHHSRIKPTNLQIEAHANFTNTELVAYVQFLGMSVTAYAPLGSPGLPLDGGRSLWTATTHPSWAAASQ